MSLNGISRDTPLSIRIVAKSLKKKSIRSQFCVNSGQ